MRLNQRADARVPFLLYWQTVPVMSSSLAASDSMATRYAVVVMRRSTAARDRSVTTILDGRGSNVVSRN